MSPINFIQLSISPRQPVLWLVETTLVQKMLCVASSTPVISMALVFTWWTVSTVQLFGSGIFVNMDGPGGDVSLRKPLPNLDGNQYFSALRPFMASKMTARTTAPPQARPTSNISAAAVEQEAPPLRSASPSSTAADTVTDICTPSVDQCRNGPRKRPASEMSDQVLRNSGETEWNVEDILLLGALPPLASLHTPAAFQHGPSQRRCVHLSFCRYATRVACSSPGAG